MVACTSDIEIEDEGAIEGTAVDQPTYISEVLYLGSRDTPLPEAEPADGLLLEPSHAFRAIDVRLTGRTEAPALEFQLLAPDGSVGPWLMLPSYSAEGEKQAAALMNLDTFAVALRLRGTEAVDFARVEFFVDPFSDEHQGHDDDAWGVDQDEVLPKAARPGRWQLPGDVRAVGDRQRVRRVSASGGCTGNLTAGARALGDYLVANFAGARNFGGYACRRIRGGRGLSVHAVGRAVDVFVPLHRGSADNDLGDPIAHWLIENAEEIGVQLIIWDRSIWSTSRSPRHRAYGGSHAHHDHLHIEITPDAANRRTAWFGGRREAPRQPAPGGGGDRGVGNACRANGAAGVCTAVAECQGQSTPGHCAGPNHVQCCTPNPAPPPDNDPPPRNEDPPPRNDPPPDNGRGDAGRDYGSCRVNGRAGECVDTGDCWGSSTPGHCPGPNNIQCCTEAADVPSWGGCRVNGRAGECLRTTDCAGTSTPGHCPGPNNVQCCT